MSAVDRECAPSTGADGRDDELGNCAAALGLAPTHPVAMQVSRVVAEIAERRPDLHADVWSMDAIQKTFHTYGLIPETLRFPEEARQRNQDIAEAFEHLARDLSCEDALCARICFAAAAYPQRIWQFPGRFAEIMERIGAFRQFAQFYDASAPITDSLARSFRQTLGETSPTVEDVRTLVRDISGGGNDAGAADEPVACGTALYLATCHPPQLERTLRFWRDDGDFLRAMRQYFASPPSYLGSGQDDLEKSRRNASDIPGIVRSEVGDDIWKKIGAIERASWGAAKKWPRVFRRRECMQEVWESLWERKIQSKFPYFTFRSHFRTWWLQEFSNYRFAAIDDDITVHDYYITMSDSLPTEADSSIPSIDDLRIYREGFRLVRTSFFSRDNSGLAELRQAVDCLWYFHLEKKLAEEDVEWGSLNKLVEQLGAVHEGLSGKLLPAYNKLRLRMWAYVLGRTTRLSNAAILRAERPIGYKDSGKPFPLKDARGLGVEMIATLARVAHRDHSLLWIFTASVFLRNRLLLNPTYKADRWELNDYLLELWHWINDPFFMRTVEYGQRPPDEDEQEEAERRGERARRVGRADRLAWAAMKQEPFKTVLEAMADLDTEEAVQDFISGRPFDDVRDALHGLLGHELGNAVFDVEAKRSAWRKALDWSQGVETHWVIPVWFLAVVEELAPDDIVTELKVGEAEQAGVKELAERWKTLWKDGLE